MALFSYRALTTDGEAVTGEIEAADARSAVARLQEGGLIPIAAEPMAARAAGSGGLFSRSLKKPVTEFTREFATLLGAGQTVEGALAMLVDATDHRRLQRTLAEVLDAVRGGKALSEAMAADPAAFPRVYTSMIRAGEASGRLEQVAAELAVLRERADALQRRLTSAMIYPAVLLLASLGSLAILLTVVVPKFAPLFANAGEALPGSTRIVLAAADLLTEQGPVILLGLLALLLILRQLLARPAVRGALDRWLLNAPLLGKLARERVTAQAMRGLATLMAGGLDLPQALGMVRDMIANQAARAAFDEVVAGVRQGRTLAACLAEADVLAPLALKMLRVGEESGRLAAVAAHLADSFEERVATRLTRLVAVIEPAMVIFLGVLVGGIVTSILTAVVSVNDLAF
ncbi:type II secretion system F family protein [Geminicoccaceae bacterium 1502E]|nr:type II secretion system F family protein [Geminicoccaceae bacterium 1502E]